MDDKTNLYVFEKKEVFLIFLFMLMIAVTSFVVGIKVGGKFAYEKAGFNDQDRQAIEMKSDQEETVEQIVNNAQTQEETKKVDINKETEEILKEEFKKEFSDENKKLNSQATNPVETKPVVKEEAKATPEKKEDSLLGKYTIQLGSYQAIRDAEDFANGFKVRGYNPIINEAQIEGRGTWFRVSLGIFKTVSEAKNYILKEKSLFSGSDYRIVQFE